MHRGGCMDYNRYIEDSVMSPPIVEITSLIKKMEREGEKVINLTQAVVDVLPPFDKEFINSLIDDVNTHLYTPDAGLWELREAYIDFLNKKFGASLNSDNIVFTPGCNAAFYTVVKSILSNDDNVVIPIPYYFNHIMAVQLSGGDVVHINTENGKFNVSDLMGVVNDKTKAVVIVSPSNPTGVAYSKDETISVLEFCKEKNIWVIIDETYSMIQFSGMTTFAELMTDYDNLIIVSSFSKTIPMAGWRLGYMLIPNVLIDNVMKIIDTIYISPPTISQRLLLHLLPNIENVYNKIRNVLYDRYRKMLIAIGKDIKVDGGCFIWYKLDGNISSEEFAKRLLDSKGIGVVPGIVFGDDRYIRISFGREEIPNKHFLWG